MNEVLLQNKRAILWLYGIFIIMLSDSPTDPLIIHWVGGMFYMFAVVYLLETLDQNIEKVSNEKGMGLLILFLL